MAIEQTTIAYQERFRNDFDRKNLIHENMTSRDLYMIGLYMGYYLKRTVYDKRLIKALRSGYPVYFLARDMTIFYDYLKDQYPNAKIVYGASRHTVNHMTHYEFEKFIGTQVNLEGRGLIVDSGFTGSMVSAVTRHYKGKTDKNGSKLLRGLLLSGSDSSSYPYILDNTGGKKIANGRRNGRKIITDLEHSPKSESVTSYGEASTILSLVKDYRSFRLGFFSGLQGLNKSLISGNFRKAIAEELRVRRKVKLRQKIRDRYIATRKINQSIKRGLKNVDLFASSSKDETFWQVTSGYNESTVERVIAHPKTPTGIKYGYSIWKSRKNAQKALDLGKSKQERINSNNPYEMLDYKADKIISALERIESYKQKLKEIEDNLVANDYYVPSYLYPKGEE